MEFHDFPGDSQPQPRPAGAGSPGGIQPEELVKNPLQLLGRNGHAGIGKGEARGSSSSLGVVLQSRRPQIGVVDIALCPIGEELAGRPRGAGWRVEEGILTKADWSKQTRRERRQSEERKDRQLTTGGGLAREYGTLPYR